MDASQKAVKLLTTTLLSLKPLKRPDIFYSYIIVGCNPFMKHLMLLLTAK